MISVVEVGKKFHQNWIFENLSLEIASGESVVLIGPSGSGKSVLLKIISGLISPDKGSVTLKTPNIGMLFQRNALFNSLTVEENLLFPLREKMKITGSPAKEKARKFLKAIGLDGYENFLTEEISGGMQKRLGIARALIVDPEIILYDDPTAGLDPITSKKIAELIQTLREEAGSTLLTVTNDIHRACQIGDRICLLAQGQLIDGGPAQAVRNSNDPRLRQFILGLREGPLTAERTSEFV